MKGGREGETELLFPLALAGTEDAPCEAGTRRQLDAQHHVPDGNALLTPAI